MRKKHLAGFALLAWLFTIAFFMVLSAYVDLELYFALGFIGLLILVELSDTVFARPRYLLRLRYVVAGGVVVFGAIVARKVLEILGT